MIHIQDIRPDMNTELMVPIPDIRIDINTASIAKPAPKAKLIKKLIKKIRKVNEKG